MPVLQSSRWVFTLNNPTTDDKDNVASLGSDLSRIKYLVVGREVGDNGTPHLQGFVVFSGVHSRARVSGFLPRAHLETARGTSKQASDYCKKDNDFDEYGTCPLNKGANGVLEALYEWSDEFVAANGRAPSSPEIARAHPTAYIRYPRVARCLEFRAPAPVIRQGEPRHGWQSELAEQLEEPCDDRRSILFYVDPEGANGKTWFQQWFISKFPEKAQVLAVGKRDDLAHYIDATKSYFFFNIPRGGMEYLSYQILENLKDQMVFSPKYNSKTKTLRKTPWVIVFSNEAPDYSKMTDDRYKVINLSA